MIASPNGVPRIVNASSAPIDAVIAPSEKIQKRFEAEFRLVKESWERADSGMFNSDDWSFLEVGIPTGQYTRCCFDSVGETDGFVLHPPW